MIFFTSLFDKISESLKDPMGKVSSARISSYFILGEILLCGLVFMGIDVTNAVIMWRKLQVYTVPMEHLGIFSLILTHHLILLGIKKARDAAFIPNITKTIEEKHYTGVRVAQTVTPPADVPTMNTDDSTGATEVTDTQAVGEASTEISTEVNSEVGACACGCESCAAKK